MTIAINERYVGGQIDGYTEYTLYIDNVRVISTPHLAKIGAEITLEVNHRLEKANNKSLKDYLEKIYNEKEEINNGR